MAAKCMQWIRARPDYGLLFSILDGLCRDRGKRYWIEHKVMGKNINGIQVDSRQMSTSVEIWLPMSHKTLTTAEEHIQ